MFEPITHDKRPNKLNDGRGKRQRRRRRARGQGTVGRRGAWWWIRWREAGQRRTAKFPTEQLARDALAKIIGLVALEDRRIPRAAARALTPDDPRTIAEGGLAEDFLARRDATHRSAYDDRNRMKTHLLPFFGNCRPDGIDAALIRRFIEAKLSAGLNPSTVKLCVALLSTFMADLKERGLVQANPCRDLPRSMRRLMKSTHDPKDTPFLKTKDDIRRVFLALAEPYNVMFAVGVLAGLRTGEVIGLQWDDCSLEERRIQVRQQVQDGEVCRLKDSDSRIAPILDTLLPILQQWRLRTGGGMGPMFRPKHPERGGHPELRRPAIYIRPNTLNTRLREALQSSGLWRETPERGRRMNWYRATRHTFASHWVLDGRSTERLRLILGHEDLSTTMRYAHLAPGTFSAADLAAVSVDLTPASGRIIPFSPGQEAGTTGTSSGGASGSGMGSEGQQKDVAQRQKG